MFDPYAAFRQTSRPFPEISFYQGRLRCLSYTVLYLPGRVLRQFGCSQPIPVMTPEYVDALTTWAANKENLVLDEVDRVPSALGTGLITDYIPWYESHSHPRCQNTANWKGPSLVATSLGEIDVVSYYFNHFLILSPNFNVCISQYLCKPL